MVTDHPKERNSVCLSWLCTGCTVDIDLMTLAIAAIVNCLSLGAGVGEYVDIILALVTTNTTDNISPVVRSGSAKVLINEKPC